MQVLYMRPGGYALGSAKSRGAARSLLEARKRDEPIGGKVSLEGLAEAIRAARMKAGYGEGVAPFLANGDGGTIDGVRRADCLAERMRQGRKRVARMQGRETMP